MNQTLLKLIKLMQREINFKGLYIATDTYDTFTGSISTLHRVEQCEHSSAEPFSSIENKDPQEIIKQLQHYLADQRAAKYYTDKPLDSGVN